MGTLYSFYKYSGGNVPNAGGDFRFELDYSYTQDTFANVSNFSASLYVKAVNTPEPFAGVFNGQILINGETKPVSKYISYVLNGRYFIGSIAQSVVHNQDGTKDCYVQGKGDYSGYSWLATENRHEFLPTIPRAPSYNSINASNTTLNSVRLTASIDTKGLSITDGGWDLSTDGGATWSYYSGSPLDKTITGLLPGKQYWFRGYVTTSGGGNNSSWGTFITVDKNRVTSSTVNVNCDSSLAVTASSASGSQCDIKIELPDLGLTEVLRHTTWWDSTTRTLNTTFTAEEIQSLASHIPNSNSTKIRITAVTVVDGVDTYFDWKDGTYSVVNANPTFSNFTYEDINPNIIELTGDSQIIVKGYSNLRAIVSVANQAVAQKGATMVKYRLVVGAKQIDVNYSSSTTVNLDLTAIDNNVFTVYAIDSRGNSTSKQISPAQYKDYFNIGIATLTAVRPDGVGTNATITFNGSIWNNSFGSVANAIKSCTYRYKKTSATTWVNGTTPITPTLSGNTYSKSLLIAGDLGANGFDSSSSYNIELTVTDKLSTKTYSCILQTGSPFMATHEKGAAFGMPYDKVQGGVAQFFGDIFVKINGIFKKVLTTNDISNILTGTSTVKPTSEAVAKTLNDKFKEYVLYNNATGTTGNVTLSDSVANYNYIEIYFTNSGYKNSKKISIGSDNKIILNTPFIYGGAYYDRMSYFTLSGTTLTYNGCLTINSNFSMVTNGSPEIVVYRVIGYK